MTTKRTTRNATKPESRNAVAKRATPRKATSARATQEKSPVRKVAAKREAPRKAASTKPSSDAPGKARSGIKTTVSDASVDAFIATVESEARRADAHALVKLFKRVSGWPPKMWGPAIIGFGAYHYTYASGHSGSICALGFSPRKANFAIYVADFPGKAELLAQLGKHKGGIEQCLYINRVADVDLDVLGRILAGGLAQLKKLWPVTAA